jgi:hypothetical protein
VPMLFAWKVRNRGALLGSKFVALQRAVTGV